MKIKYGYLYFVHSSSYHIFDDNCLQFYKPNTILMHHNDCGTSIELLYYNGVDVILVDNISDDLIYSTTDCEFQDAKDYFMELLEPALTNKVNKNIELTDEDIETIPTVFIKFIWEYADLPENIKSRVVKIN